MAPPRSSSASSACPDFAAAAPRIFAFALRAAPIEGEVLRP